LTTSRSPTAAVRRWRCVVDFFNLSVSAIHFDFNFLIPIVGWRNAGAANSQATEAARVYALIGCVFAFLI
jgi:hypothetical protein